MSGKFYTKFAQTNGKARAKQRCSRRGSSTCFYNRPGHKSTGSRWSALVVALGRRLKTEVQSTMYQERQR